MESVHDYSLYLRQCEYIVSTIQKHLGDYHFPFSPFIFSYYSENNILAFQKNLKNILSFFKHV